jgi:hypothetical protein
MLLKHIVGGMAMESDDNKGVAQGLLGQRILITDTPATSVQPSQKGTAHPNWLAAKYVFKHIVGGDDNGA